ncbi:hypothetical protein HDU96_010899 [Phlyctochytrium bullatum]|nr:hypothetical protein HDU96_010899 [Phlyctochytrium bullatum]
MTAVAIAAGALACLISATNAQVLRVEQRALVLTPALDKAASPVLTLRAYGMPYDVVEISPTKSDPFTLEDSTAAKYSMIILASGQMVAVYPNNSVLSTLSDARWNELHAYQRKYGVRLVALDDLPPGPKGQATTSFALPNDAGGDFNTTFGFANTAIADAAGLRTDIQMPTSGLFCYPARLNETTSSIPIVTFTSSSLIPANSHAAVHYRLDSGLREQLSFFCPFGADIATSLALSHVWFQWASRGAFPGIRRVYLSPQVDDFFMSTIAQNISGIRGAGEDYRTSVADVQGLVEWQKGVNSRLPDGSMFKLDMAFTGNSILYQSRAFHNNSVVLLQPVGVTRAANRSFLKPPGTGYTLWPETSTLNLTWDVAAIRRGDPVFDMFYGNNDALGQFFWNHHSFTHEIFDNNTYGDTYNEIQFNYRMATLLSLPSHPSNIWSNASMVTPDISGIFNSDALRAMHDSSLRHLIGDISRPDLLNPENAVYWPRRTTAEGNGFEGMWVIPRLGTNVRFDASTWEYNEAAFAAAGDGRKWSELIRSDMNIALQSFLGLSWRPYMFHQANLRNADLPPITVPSLSTPTRLGPMQEWLEYWIHQYTQWVRWPLVSLKIQDVSELFVERWQREKAGVRTVTSGWINKDQESVVLNVTFWIDVAARVLQGLGVPSEGIKMPYTLPKGVGRNDIQVIGPATSSVRYEQRGIDPVTVWFPVTSANTASNPVVIKFVNAALPPSGGVSTTVAGTTGSSVVTATASVTTAPKSGAKMSSGGWCAGVAAGLFLAGLFVSA